MTVERLRQTVLLGRRDMTVKPLLEMARFGAAWAAMVQTAAGTPMLGSPGLAFAPSTVRYGYGPGITALGARRVGQHANTPKGR